MERNIPAGDVEMLYNTLQSSRIIFENSDIQVPMILVLLDLSRRQVTPMSDIEANVGISQSAVSRIVSKLGIGMPRERGLGFLDSYEDPEYRRRKLVRLTPKGKDVVKLLTEIMNGKKYFKGFQEVKLMPQEQIRIHKGELQHDH